MDAWHNFSDQSGDKSSTTYTVEKHQSHLATSKDNQPETNEESSIEITTMNTDNGVSEVTHSIQKNSKILSDAELSNRSDTARSTAASYKDRNNHSNIFGAPMVEPPYGRKHASNTSTTPPPPTVTSPEYYDAKHHLEYHGVQHHDEKHHDEKHHEEKEGPWNKSVNVHISSTPSKIAERYKFRQRYQSSNECIADYVLDLQRLAEPCNFGNQLETNLRDQLVSGLRNDEIRSRLFREKVLTYGKALEICLNMEQAERIELKTKPDSGNHIHGMNFANGHNQQKKSFEYDDTQYEEKRSPRKDGNPISGEGYGGDTVTNEIGAYRQHSNVPPGGFCSNIWYE